MSHRPQGHSEPQTFLCLLAIFANFLQNCCAPDLDTSKQQKMLLLAEVTWQPRLRDTKIDHIVFSSLHNVCCFVSYGKLIRRTMLREMSWGWSSRHVTWAHHEINICNQYLTISHPSHLLSARTPAGSQVLYRVIHRMSALLAFNYPVIPSSGKGNHRVRIWLFNLEISHFLNKALSIAGWLLMCGGELILTDLFVFCQR